MPVNQEICNHSWVDLDLQRAARMGVIAPCSGLNYLCEVCSKVVTKAYFKAEERVGIATDRHYRKKPVMVEAIRWMGDLSVLHDWMLAANGQGLPIVLSPLPDLTIETLEGEMTCKVGDWIVKGVEGEFYPVKHSIFEKTYEKLQGFVEDRENFTTT